MSTQLSQSITDFFGDHQSVKMAGAKGDTRTVADAAMSSSSSPTHLSSATAAFTAADVGKHVNVGGAGVAGAVLSTTIASISSGTVAVLAASASTTVSGAFCAIGTDDTVAISDAIAATPRGGTLLIPAGNYMVTGIQFPSGYSIVIRGAGRLSSIIGTGITILQMTYAGQRLENLQILDPVGDDATVGLYCYGNTPASPDANQITVSGVTILGRANFSGGHSIGLGVGIMLRDTVNVHFYEVTESYFKEGVTPHPSSSFNTTIRLVGCNFLNNGDIGYNFSLADSGEVSATHCNFEGNKIGVLGNGVKFSAFACHFEANWQNHFQVAAGIIDTLCCELEGGTAQVDSAGVWISHSDGCSGTTVTNNGNGGGYGTPGTANFYPQLGPTFSGSGWSQYFIKNGFFQRNAGSSTYQFSGGGSGGWSFDSALKSLGPFTAQSIQSPVIQGAGTASSGLNVCTESGGSANNALVASLLDANGNAVTPGGEAIVVLSTSHTLQAGGNTLNLNSTGARPILTMSGNAFPAAWGPGVLVLISHVSSYWFAVMFP